MANAQAWKDRLEAWKADVAWGRERAELHRQRELVGPAILKLVESYRAGTTSLEDFRSTFDKRTRKEWSCFGAKGLSGGMVLNQLVKHAPDAAKADAELRAVLDTPRDEASAANAIRRFASFLESIREGATEVAKLPQPGRTAFFASSFWHVAAPETWPIYFTSAREVLGAEHLTPPAQDDLGANYLTFRDAFQKLQRAHGLSTWELESLLAWLHEDDATSGATPAGTSPGPDADGKRTWLIALGRNSDQFEQCFKDGIIAIGWNQLGNLQRFGSLDEIRAALRDDRDDDAADPMNAGLACWQFLREMQPGDEVFVKRGRHLIIGHGVITSGYRYEPKGVLHNVRSVRWQGRGEWKPRERPLVMKTLTEIGQYPALVRAIRKAIGDGGDDGVEAPGPSAPSYTFEQAERELFMGADQLRDAIELLRHKKNLILQGPPGVGKTLAASRIAYVLIGSEREDQLQRVQFHPSYAYEDFVQGLRPAEGGGFVRKDGPLLRFCKAALEDQSSPYVLIIDEINRGNVSKILGELLSLFESDKRDPRYGVTLAYAEEDEPRFHVPPNLHVIGMMNTADRSLALVDYALRRRFAFVDLVPAFHSDRFRTELTRRGVPTDVREAITKRLGALNERIAADPALGRGFMVGHSYFCQRAETYDVRWFQRIVEYELAPLLREYWFDNPKALEDALAALRGG